MQRNEVIIGQFVKTIKESSLDVAGDPTLLNNIFEGLEKQKKKRKLFNVFLFTSFVLTGLIFVTWGVSMLGNQTKQSKSMLEPNEHLIPKMSQNTEVIPVDKVEGKNTNVAPTKKINRTTTKKENNDFKNVVSYRFNSHQVDVFENGDQEFIQINVFGEDGVEQDVLKIMEDLKKSYRKNEVYVDSVKHK